MPKLPVQAHPLLRCHFTIGALSFSLSVSSRLMGSMLGDWPSYDPHNFSQLRPSDKDNPSRSAPATYRPTHNRTLPPPDQGIAKNSVLYLNASPHVFMSSYICFVVQGRANFCTFELFLVLILASYVLANGKMDILYTMQLIIMTSTNTRQTAGTGEFPFRVISTESKNILIRHFYKHAEEKLRPKRAASEFLAPETGSKHQRPSTSDTRQ